ncbi:MAG: tyrosine-type recombinase/integrase [Fibrobacter sp.]|nr:tyrosine-type recombinase/integrase [Fibrobacter sp.]
MIRVSLCQRAKSRGILTWYARIFNTETKEIRYESLGTTKKTAAHDLMLAKQADGEFEHKRSDTMTLGRAFELYIHSLEMRDASPKTLQTVRNSLNKVRDLYGMQVASIRKGDLVEVFDRNTDGVMPSSYNTMKTYVKTAFKYAVTVLEAADSNPADALRSRKSQKRERDFWTPEQIDRILDGAPYPSMRLLWSLMAFAGLRVHEAEKLRPEDIHDGFIYVVGKGNKPAKIPVSSRMQEELDRYKGDWKLPGHNSSSYNLGRVAKRALGDEQVGPAFNHRFRHSFASNLCRAGVSPASLMKLMRHSNIATTMNIYAHMIDGDLKEDIEKMFRKP